jgi:predicted RNA binding protein with dsRBD fold (UPF0201 family)
VVRVVVEVEVRPTESEEKVKKAVFSVIKPSNLRVEGIHGGFKLIKAECGSIECLKPLREMALKQQVEPALRSYLNKYRRGTRITLLLHKQAAYAEKLSLVDSERESPLGPIKLEIECASGEEVERVIEYLTGSSQCSEH